MEVGVSKPVVIVLGAGLGGVIAAYELRHVLGDRVELTVVSKGETFHFVPSNPWVAVNWRRRDAIEVALPPVMEKRGIGFSSSRRDPNWPLTHSPGSDPMATRSQSVTSAMPSGPARPSPPSWRTRGP